VLTNPVEVQDALSGEHYHLDLVLDSASSNGFVAVGAIQPASGAHSQRDDSCPVIYIH
jgi:hypothetical protein